MTTNSCTNLATVGIPNRIGLRMINYRACQKSIYIIFVYFFYIIVQVQTMLFSRLKYAGYFDYIKSKIKGTVT